MAERVAVVNERWTDELNDRRPLGPEGRLVDFAVYELTAEDGRILKRDWDDLGYVLALGSTPVVEEGEEGSELVLAEYRAGRGVRVVVVASGLVESEARRLAEGLPVNWKEKLGAI